MFACIEVELKPSKRVLKRLEILGRDWKGEGKPKIIYTSNKVYTSEEVKIIFEGDWSIIKLGPFELRDIKQLRPSITESLCGNDNITVGLKLEAYIRSDIKKVIRAQQETKRNFSVYVFQLQQKACESQVLLKNNQPKNRKKQAFYVGQTSLNIAERFDVHINPNNPSHRKGSSIMRKFALSDQFDECNQTFLFEILSGIKTTELTYYESLANEQKMTLYIRNQYNAFSHSN
jgi:hypothetical protein